MRVYLTRPLLRVVEGADHTLNIRGRLGRPVSAEIESRLAELPKQVATQFNLSRDELLSPDERATLKKTIREVQAMPVRRKVFVLDETSFRSHARLVGRRDAIREASGIVHEQPSPACDYYVTDRREAAEIALRAGAKQVPGLSKPNRRSGR